MLQNDHLILYCLNCGKVRIKIRGDYMQILLILLSSGSLGFISYLILRELSILNFPLREKDIEKVTLIHFSIFNAIAVYFLYWLIFKVDLFQINLNIIIFSKIIVLSLVTSVFMSFVYAVVLKIFRSLFEKIQKKRNLITTKYKPLFDDLFLPEQYEDVYVIIFNFSNEFIHAGHLDRVEYKEGKLYFSLYAAPYNDVYTYDKVVKEFHEDGLNLDRLKIIIDTDRQQKYFLKYNPYEV